VQGETKGGNASVKAIARALAATWARVVEALVVVWLLASLVFFALRLLPGDPAALVLGDDASPAELARVRASLHLDLPLGEQYLRFLRGLATLDLGESLRRPGVSAMARVVDSLGPTSALAAAAVALGAVVGIGAALLAAGPWLRPRSRAWIDRALVSTSAMPLLAFAPVLTYALAARARLVPLPGDPDAGLTGLLFASALLSVPLAAHAGRVGRAALGDLGRAPFLVVATQLGALLGGAVVLERLFERAGLGTLILEAYASRDLPVLEGAVVAAGALFVASQAIAAAVQAAIDPRVRA